MRVEVISAGNATRWDAVVRASQYYDFYHLAAYHEIAQSRREGTAFLYRLEEGQYWLAIPLLVRPVAEVAGLEAFDWSDATSVYGYAGPVVSHDRFPADLYPQFTSSLASTLRSQGVVAVFSRLHPFLPQAAALQGAGEIREVGPTVWVDLTAPEAVQWNEVRARHRTAINRLRREGFNCGLDESLAHLEQFVRAYHETMARVGAGRYYYFEREYFERLLAAKTIGAKLFVCKRGQDFACGGIFVACNRFIQYHLGGTVTSYLRHAPMKLLFDEVRRWGTQAGAAILHLGGGVGASQDGLFFFKAGFSRRRATFCTWRWILDEVAVARLCAARGGTGSAADVPFFPPYRA